MERYVIHVTKECNMDCLYCYEKDKVSKYTWEEVQTLIDKIIQHNKDREFAIEFLGGEPLLAFDLIQSAFNYIEYGPYEVSVPHYAITTNGTILDDKIIKFMKENSKVSFFASMDGTKGMNQLRVMKHSRKNSYDVVVENLQRLIKEGLSAQIGVHLVTHPYNVGYLSQGIDHLYSLGIKHIGVGTVESTIIIDEEYSRRFLSEMKLVSDRVISGMYPGMIVDLLEYLKPRSDRRHYIRDDQGKLIAESYGRTQNDITDTNEYNSTEVTSRLGTLISDLREDIYNYHQRKKRG